MSPLDTFRHEALLYEGPTQFADRTAAFVRAGLDAGESVLVAVVREKVGLLAAALGRDSRHVRFADMRTLGRNPARIIPAWRAFVDENVSAGRPFRGVGEPIWAGRSPAEIDECHRHEALINVAFADSPPWSLLCPYDVGALDPEVVHGSEHTHPGLVDGTVPRPSSRFASLESLSPLAGEFPPPPRASARMEFGLDRIDEVRRVITEEARRCGLLSGQIDDMVVAASEIAANSIRHGGGHGVLQLWVEDEALVCEVADDGHIGNPLVGRIHPHADAEDGRGLWLANHLCDLVQVRSSAGGTVVRMHMSLPDRTASLAG